MKVATNLAAQLLTLLAGVFVCDFLRLAIGGRDTKICAGLELVYSKVAATARTYSEVNVSLVFFLYGVGDIVLFDCCQFGTRGCLFEDVE